MTQTRQNPPPPAKSSQHGKLPSDADYAAIRANDASQDGRFLYGVSSTRIFCRPSCTSRLPKRENIRIFSGQAEAEMAGYRPCKRCRPETQADADKRLERARQLIDARLAAGEPAPSLTELGKAAHISPTHLQRLFAAAYGLSPRAYAEARRVALLKTGLKQGADVTDAIYGAGFGAPSRVYEKADRWLGMTPADYRRGGAGLALTVSILPSRFGGGRLGHVLVAQSPRGIAALLLGEADASMLAELQAEFPAATLQRDDAAGRPVVAALDDLLAGRKPKAALPLDLRGTAFQIRVWQALAAIPRGETRSYREIAIALGEPKAARAVGSACGSNILGVLVPCHRALRSDGGLGGYRWGLARKQAILEAEAAE